MKVCVTNLLGLGTCIGGCMDERGCNCSVVCLGITQLIFVAAFGVGYVWSFISGLITLCRAY